jgi:hypothetical protein
MQVTAVPLATAGTPQVGVTYAPPNCDCGGAARTLRVARPAVAIVHFRYPCLYALLLPVVCGPVPCKVFERAARGFQPHQWLHQCPTWLVALLTPTCCHAHRPCLARRALRASHACAVHVGVRAGATAMYSSPAKAVACWWRLSLLVAPGQPSVLRSGVLAPVLVAFRRLHCCCERSARLGGQHGRSAPSPPRTPGVSHSLEHPHSVGLSAVASYGGRGGQERPGELLAFMGDDGSMARGRAMGLGAIVFRPSLAGL